LTVDLFKKPLYSVFFSPGFAFPFILIAPKHIIHLTRVRLAYAVLLHMEAQEIKAHLSFVRIQGVRDAGLTRFQFQPHLR
jgi:hypothetical protein